MNHPDGEAAEKTIGDLERQRQVAADYYGPGRAGKYEQDYEGVPFALRAADFLKKFVEDGMRVLDVGCGPGHLTARLHESVHVVGTDISPAMIEKAKSLPPTGEYFVHDYYSPQGCGEFDIVLASGCLDLCDDIGLVLSHLCTSLRESGLLYFSVLERRGSVGLSSGRTFELPWEGAPPLLLHVYTIHEQLVALTKAGLIPNSYEFAPGWSSRTLGDSFSCAYWVVAKAPALPGSQHELI